jgi:hypothetical protein
MQRQVKDLIANVNQKIVDYLINDNPEPEAGFLAKIGDFFSSQSAAGRRRAREYNNTLESIGDNYDDALFQIFLDASYITYGQGVLGSSKLLRIRLLETICDHLNNSGHQITQESIKQVIDEDIEKETRALIAFGGRSIASVKSEDERKIYAMTAVILETGKFKERFSNEFKLSSVVRKLV